MRYTDGNEAMFGDTVAIDVKYRGVVMGIIEKSRYADGFPAEQWDYLKKGILVDTDFGGFIHYPDAENEGAVAENGKNCTPRAGGVRLRPRPHVGHVRKGRNRLYSIHLSRLA